MSLLLFPEALLTLPIWRAIVPEIEVHIKVLCNETSKAINQKSHFLVGN